MPQQPYHVYMDLDAINNNYGASSPPQLRLEETRDHPFLEGDSSEYFCSIVRFSIQTGNSLPVFIPKINPKGVDPINDTIYVITMVYTDATLLGGTVVYTNEKCVSYTPSVPYTGGALPPNYYHVYNYGDFINMVNKSLQLAMVKGDFLTALESLQKPYFAPFLEFDPSTFKCTLIAQKDFFRNAHDTYPFRTYPINIQLYFNTSLQALFPSFPYEFNSSKGNMNYRLIFNDSNFLNSIQVNTNPSATSLADASLLNSRATGIQIFQEISGVSLWNPIASLVFTTSLLPIVPSQTSRPKVYDDPSVELTSGGQANIASILSDFEVSVSPTDQYRPDITYVPPGEYRLVDMYSTYNLNKVDLSVFWKDNFGNLNPFYLQPGCSARVKLMFRRKDLSLV